MQVFFCKYETHKHNLQSSKETQSNNRKWKKTTQVLTQKSCKE